MSDDPNPGSPARRAIVKGTAWAVPVIAAAVAAPAAAASVNALTVALTNPTTSMLTLHVLGSSSTLTATALVTVPTAVSYTNGPGAVSETATITVTVGRPGGLNLPVGRARGFGVYSYNGTLTTAASRTVTYEKDFLGNDIGFPETTWTSVQPVSVTSNGSIAVPIEFGLAGSHVGVAISALASFPVTITVVVGGRTLTALGTISVPVGAGIL